MSKITREDVARAANVSGTTVSRVLSGKDSQISEDARRRVRDAVERLGYVPNAAAKALMTGQTHLVGLWMCLGYSKYRAHVLGRMQSILAKTEYAIAVTDVEEDLYWHHSMARALRVPVDGILAFDTPTAGDSFARTDKNQAGTTPLVGMGAYWSKATSFVGVDLGAGVKLAMQHLFDIGLQDIAFFCHEANSPDEIRAKAYVAAMVAKGFVPKFIPCTGLGTADAAADLQAYLASQAKPQAILCFNDEIALGAAQALMERGLTPGPDVAIIGCDGIEETALLPYPLTTIAQPVDAMCALAWEFLAERLENPAASLRQEILIPSLVVRASTRR